MSTAKSTEGEVMSTEDPQSPQNQPENQPPVVPPVPVYPPPAPPANSYQPAPQNGLGTAALIMGILQFFCIGTLGSILAIIFGLMGMKKAEQGLATNGGQAKAGFWLGIIGLILSIIAIIAVAVAVANGGGEWSFNVGSN